MKDLFGKALLNYHQSPGTQTLDTWTNLTEIDPVPIAYFFRSFNEMPKIEQRALSLCRGHVLDIGCGTGSHSLYLQNKKQLSVTGIDLSPGAIQVAKRRGLSNTLCNSIFEYSSLDKKYDTLLLLMNGLGIARELSGVSALLEHLKEMLSPGGQILVDSSDLIYLFDEDEVSAWLADERYYGEVDYGIGFNGEKEEFPWLYLDYKHLEQLATLSGFRCEKIVQGPNYDFLARLEI